MADSRTPVAVVTAISGRRQYKVELKGVANHAGSTPMKFRSDALVEAAKMICEIQKMPARISEQAVATVGWIQCQPNATQCDSGKRRIHGRSCGSPRAREIWKLVTDGCRN